MSEDFDGSTLLLTGGTGFLGSTVVSDLAEQFPGRLISVQRATITERLPNPHLQRQCDLRHADGWHDLLLSSDFVLWMAALRDHSATSAEAYNQNVAPLSAALEVLHKSQRLKRFVFVSSISAIDQAWHPHFPQAIDDLTTAHPCTPYGASKLAGEKLLATSGLPYTVLRLPFLYGPNFGRGSFLNFYRLAARAPLLSSLRYTADLSLLYTGDFAQIIIDVLARSNSHVADMSPYVVSDGKTYCVDDLISIVARLHGMERPRWRVPAAVSRMISASAIRSRAFLKAGPVQRSHQMMVAIYWIHAAFTPAYFAVDSSRFSEAFPGCFYTPVEFGLARAFGREII